VISNADVSLNPNGKFYYVHDPDAFGVNGWHEMLLPATGVSPYSEPFLAVAFWDAMKVTAKYATPLEDMIILIDGKDFDGVEQSKLEAGIWLVVGVIPGGSAGKVVKPVMKVAKNGDVVAKVLKVNGKSINLPYKIVNGVVDFGSDSYNRSQLRKLLNIVDSKIQAHHIIPWAFRNSEIVQKAAKADKKFHISEKLNGIPFSSSNHLTGHPKYSLKIEQKLIQLNAISPSNEIAYQKITSFINDLTVLIKNISDKNLGQIADLIN
tara:strand:- start:13180 stop:13974 length:795 start_codon:yes stop_codon:yes gene_type:complete